MMKAVCAAAAGAVLALTPDEASANGKMPGHHNGERVVSRRK